MLKGASGRQQRHELHVVSGPLAPQPRGFDLFRLPGLRRLARYKYARLLFQLPLLLLAIFVIIDGLTGRQIAPRNLATTTVWLHYRGLVVIALALFGNAFCAACPLMLTRGASRRLERLLPRKFEWPARLKSKWLVLGLMFVYFFVYERFDLWASPWLTAWLAIGYFGAALCVDTLFKPGTFCKYVCPLGNFNFVYSALSPTQVVATNPDVCRECEHKPCLHGRYTAAAPGPGADASLAFVPLSDITNPNGSGRFPGCETDLFVPTIVSNMDCTYCFNCVRACPYDNVALVVRAPGAELTKSPWARRGRLAVMTLAGLLGVWGAFNAFAMVGAYYDLAEWLSDFLGTRSESLILALVLLGVTAVGSGLVLGAAALADRLGGAKPNLRASLERWGYVFVASGFGFWGAHYLFHALTGALSIVPVTQHFFEYRGFGVDPDWRLAQVVPSAWLFPLQAVISGLSALLATFVAARIAMRDFGKRGVLALWPVLLLVIVIAGLQVALWAQPMEMRGTLMGPQ